MQETPVKFLGRKIHWRRHQLPTLVFLGFPVAQLVKNLPAMWETWVQSLGWEDPLEKEKATTPVFWPEEFHGLYSPWGHKELDTTERLSLFTIFMQNKHLFRQKMFC